MASKLPADAFEFYVGLGADRSYQAVANQYGVTKRAVTNRAKRDGWQPRVEALEAQARRASEQRVVETLEEMNTRHIKSLRVIQARALEALRNMPLESAMDAVRALDIAIRHERLVRGEPTDRTAVNLEQIIRGEYARWMRIEDEAKETEGNGETGIR